MPLQNRVDPFGSLIADPARGLFMGNRGGRFHTDARTLPSRRWVSRQWICCRLQFNDRHRQVWRTGYTELFFLDEPTALAAGHRPCFECRRDEARAFAAAFAAAHRLKAPARAADIDRVLHAERLDGREKRTHRARIDDLPDGAFVTLDAAPAQPMAVRGRSLLQWTPAGYAARPARPRGVVARVLTPPGMLGALAAGYAPHWHPSADAAARA